MKTVFMRLMQKVTMRALLLLMAIVLLALTVLPPQKTLAQVCSEAYLRNRQVAILNCIGDIECEVGPGGNIGSGGTVAPSFSLGSDARERRINLIQALMNDYGLTPEQASGVVGNFMQESGGEHLPPDVNQGDTQGAPPRFSGGYGWAQWTGGRQRTFIDFAVAEGYMGGENEHATDAANYAYLKHELDTGYTDTITQLRQQSTPESAAVSFHETFERSADNAQQIAERGTSAQQAYDDYIGGGGTPSGGSTASNCPTEGDAAIVGDFAFPLVPNKGVVNNPEMFGNGTADQGGHPYTAYDILADPGVQVVAAMRGTVTHIGTDRCPGRLISIHNQESDLTITYMHLAFDGHVAEGATVEPGDPVGTVGPASNGCGIPHLHIDAIRGDTRLGCSRNGCPASTRALFVDIGPQLYETFQVLPD